MTNPLRRFSREINKIIETTLKRSVDNSYELHYNRQLLMKLLAHFIAVSIHKDEKFLERPLDDKEININILIRDLNSHEAKVHFTQDEINDIKIIIEESKKFI